MIKSHSCSYTLTNNQPKKQKSPLQEAIVPLISIGCGGVIFLVVLLWIISSFTRVETPEQERTRKEEEISKWFDLGSNRSCEDNLKEQLRDPNSYERDGEFVLSSNNGEVKIITWEFRSKNGFGGLTNGIGMCAVSKKNGGTYKATILSQ